MPVQVCWVTVCDASPRVWRGHPCAHGSRPAPRLLCTAWFKFAQPWNLTVAHFAANATVGLKLAFDLAGMVKGVSTTRCGNTIYDNATGTDFQVSALSTRGDEVVLCMRVPPSHIPRHAHPTHLRNRERDCTHVCVPTPPSRSKPRRSRWRLCRTSWGKKL